MSRTGRSKQRYDAETGARCVCGIVVYKKEQNNVFVLLISSSKGTKWVLPKGKSILRCPSSSDPIGGWETDESASDCAIRETFEEAGIHASIDSTLCTFLDDRKRRNQNHKKGREKDKYAKSDTPQEETNHNGTHFTWFSGTANLQCETWPEMEWRQRRWMEVDQALSLFRESKADKFVTAIEALKDYLSRSA